MTTTGQMKPPFQRLPTTVTPLVYKLTLQPDLTKFTFEGSQVIEIKVNQPTQVITFNANDIQIHPNGLAISYAEKVVEIAKIDYNTEQETVTLSFKEQLPIGDAKLSLKFSGNLNDKLYGFYASKYTGPDGVIRHIAVTQFEATYARWAFPCWDEPALKARFDISLIIPNDGKTLALSNMSVAFEAVVTDQLKIVHFKQTPLMSTYLVAFVVGEFDFVEGTSPDGVKVRVYTPVSKREQGIFALEMSGKALDFYKSYFNIAYPLDKMDLIAIPDFAMGAMENWGLVTYREICLLVDPLNTSTVRKQNIALTVAHELAHQWFGNLVTMEWWTDLWLNEGFASFAECLCVDKLFPQFDIWTQFVANVLLRALQLDALDSSHPIEIPVGHPSEIDEIFDAISYCKGASIIRLLHKYIGEEAFRKGMNLYLTRHSYKNAQTDHLWDALEEASKKPVRRVMTTWTKQKGFPVVLVNARPDKSNCQIVKLEQAKYTLIGDKSSSSLSASSKDKPTLWSIPLPIITETSMAKPVLYWLFETRDFNFSLKVPPTEWFKLNPSTVGFYRVSYPPELLSRFVSGIVNQSIPALDRLGLINDLQALVLAGWKSAIELFKFMTAFKGELNYVVWCALSSILDKFTQLFAGSQLAEPFRKFGLNLLTSHVFPSIGWSGKLEESYQDTMLRTLIINQLVNLEHAEVNTRCRELFQEQLQNQKAIPVDLRAAVYQSVVGHADEKTFEDMLKLHRECDLQEEQYRIASSLGHVKQECFIQDILNFAISDQVRSQDTIFVIGSIASNPVGRESAWQFFKAHREVWTARYGSGGLISRLVKLVTENFVTEEKASEVEQFFREHKFPGTERSVQQALETIRSNAALLRRDTAVLEKFFQSQ